MTDDDEVNTAGWDAITAALQKLYGDQEPQHFGTVLPSMLGGNDPLDGISAYRADEPTPHWHFVTYGLSELYEKTNDSPLSGFGLELTFRLSRKPREKSPPAWAMNFLQNLARYVFNTGNVFDAGHHMPFNGPIAVGKKTNITAGVFDRDPELRDLKTPNGKLSFVQVAGITDEELTALKAWQSDKFLALLRKELPRLITDLARPSLTDQPAIAAKIERGRAKDGSSTGTLYVGGKWRKSSAGKLTVELGANSVQSIASILPGRLPFQQQLAIVFYENEQLLILKPAKKSSWKVKGDDLTISLSPADLRELLEKLEPHESAFAWPGLENAQAKIVKSYIKDADGKVVRVVG